MADIFKYENGNNTLGFLLMTMVIGIILACGIMLWQIKVPGKLVRSLSQKKAYGEDGAVKAGELGYTKEWLLRYLLSENGALRKYVGIKSHEKDGKGRDVLLSSELYLKEKTRDRAELRYRANNATTGALIAAIILFSLLAVAMHFVIPELIQMLENFVNQVKAK